MYEQPHPTDPPGRRWRLRWRLTIALALLFGAVFAVVAWSHYENLGNQKDSRVESMRQVQRTVAALLDGFTGDLESFALSTAITLGDARLSIEADELDPEREATVNAYLDHLFQSYGVLRSIFITEPDGTVVYSNGGGSAGRDLSSRSYIRALQDGADSFWSEGVPGIESGRTIVTHSRRIVTPEGETSGFLAFAFYPESLIDRLPSGLQAGGIVSLYDQNGQLLLRLPQPEGGTQLTHSPWPQLADARNGREVLLQSTEVPLLSGNRYVALSGLNHVDWVVSYSLPSSAVIGEANAIFQRDLALLAGLMLVGLVLTLYIAHRVSQPLSRLGVVAEAIAHGEKADALETIETSEQDLSSLVAAMRYMKDAIRAREQQLSTHATIIESIERTGESLAGELELERAVNAIIDAGVKLTRAEASLFLYRRGPNGELESAGEQDRPDSGLRLEGPLVQEVLTGSAVHVADVESREQAANGNRVPGSSRPRSVMGIPIRFRSGEITGALFLTHSKPDAFSDEDMRLAGGLARWAGIVLENAELYQRSQEVQELLRQANEDKDEFLAMVSHELRTPITTIYGGSRLLHTRREILNESAIADMIASVAEEAEQLYHLVEDLLAIARTESSTLVDREPVSVGRVLGQTVQQFLRSHDREVTLSVPEDMPPVLADPTYLSQVVGNLLGNADKYTAPGLPVEIDAWQEGEQAIVRVRDHGPGVPEEDLERIFERFFRSEAAQNRASGKGLGLTVCKRLVESMQGRIWARNHPDGGLEVAIALALADEVELEAVGSEPAGVE